MPCELHQLQIPLHCRNVRQRTLLILQCISQCLLILDQTDKWAVNTLVHEHIRHQLILNLHDEQFIPVVAEHNVCHVHFLVQVEHLVVQDTPEVQILIHVLEDDLGALLVGVEFVQGGFEALFGH